MKRKTYLMLFLFIVPLFFTWHTALADGLPNISLSNLTFKQDGNEILGTVDVYNNENQYVLDTYYDISLYSGNTEEDFFISNDHYDLKPKSSTKVDFTYNLPSDLIKGSYSLKVDGVFENGVVYDSVSKDLVLQNNLGSGIPIFLNAYKSSLSSGSYNYSMASTSGNTINEDANAVLHVDILNNSNQAETVYPFVSVSPISDRTYLLGNHKENPVTVDVGRETVVDIQMPVLSKPGNYIATVKGLDANSKSISNIIQFNFTVNGDSAQINGAGINSLKLQSGKADNMSIYYSGSTSDQRGFIYVYFYDSAGQLIAKSEGAAILNGANNEINLNIKPPFNVNNFTFKIAVADSSKNVLDMETVEPSLGSPTSTFYFFSNSISMATLMFVSFIILVMTAVWYFVTKRRKDIGKMKGTIMIIVAFISLFALFYSFSAYRQDLVYDSYPILWQNLVDFQPPAVNMSSTNIVPDDNSLKKFLTSYINNYYYWISQKNPNWPYLTVYTDGSAEIDLINSIASGDIHSNIPLLANNSAAKAQNINIQISSKSTDLANLKATYDVSYNGNIRHYQSSYELCNEGQDWRIYNIYK